MIALLSVSLVFGGWRYVVAVRLQRERALEQERLRIARDIHDEVGASLTKIGRLATKLPDSDIAETTREVVQAMDEIVWAVNPRNDTLDNMANYLVHYTEEFVRPTGIRCGLDVPFTLPARALMADIRHNVFMVVKEALNNAVKHGSPGSIRLGLALEGDLLTLVVQDDGCGFTPAPAAEGADGLANMRQRMAAVGGQIQLDSAPGKGTTVTLTVMLNGKGKSH
jgi:signal transduction histidine kinase